MLIAELGGEIGSLTLSVIAIGGIVAVAAVNKFKVDNHEKTFDVHTKWIEDLRSDQKRQDDGFVNLRIMFERVMVALDRRGQMALANENIGRFNSPFTLSEDAKKLVPQELIQKIAATLPNYKEMTRAELCQHMLMNHDSDLYEMLCKEHKWDRFQCYSIVASVMLGEEEIS